MRTRSNRTYNNTWHAVLNFPTLMRQAPATATHHSPQSDMSSDSETTPSPSPRPRRRTSIARSRPTRADVVIRNVAILGVVLAVALMFVNLALYVAIFAVGVLAPAWQTYKVLEARDRPIVVELDPDDDQSFVAEPREMRNWQAYWVIAAILLAADGLIMSPFLGRILPAPLYHSMLFTLVTWLTRNRAGNAAAVYDCYLKPALQKSEKTIDGAVDSVLTCIDHASQQAVLAINEAVAPYARHLEHAAAAATKQMHEQRLAHGQRVGGHNRHHRRQR